SRQCQVAAPIHKRGLDSGQVATCTCPCHTCCYAYFVLFFCLPIEILLWTKVIGNFLRDDPGFATASLGHFACHFAHYRGYFAFQVAYTSLRGILTGDATHGIIAYFDTRGFETMLTHLFRNEELLGNV